MQASLVTIESTLTTLLAAQAHQRQLLHGIVQLAQLQTARAKLTNLPEAPSA